MSQQLISKIDEAVRHVRSVDFSAASNAKNYLDAARYDVRDKSCRSQKG